MMGNDKLKTHNIKYLQLITQAKDILKDIDNHKMKIADLAIKACTIKLGGHIRGFYSIKQFAEDVGMKQKTLSAWIQARKVQITLKKKNIKVEDETKLNAIRRTLSKDHIMGEDRCTKFDDPRRVIPIYHAHEKRSDEDRMLDNMLVRVGTMKFHLVSYVLQKLNQEDLSNLRKLLQECIDTIDTIDSKAPTTRLRKNENEMVLQ